jgi:hypothetical protein
MSYLRPENSRKYLPEFEAGCQAINDDATFKGARKSFWVSFPTRLI